MIEQTATDEKIERNTKDIEEVKKKLEGMPERMDNVERQIEKLSVTIEKFIDELRRNYQTKDNCQMCRESMEKDIQANRETMEKEISGNTYVNKVIIGIVCGVCGVGLTALGTVILKQIGLM